MQRRIDGWRWPSTSAAALENILPKQPKIVSQIGKKWELSPAIENVARAHSFHFCRAGTEDKTVGEIKAPHWNSCRSADIVVDNYVLPIVRENCASPLFPVIPAGWSALAAHGEAWPRTALANACQQKRQSAPSKQRLKRPALAFNLCLNHQQPTLDGPLH